MMPFSPTDIAGLHAWWKADSLALSDSDPVATWTDSGTGGFNATQGTAGFKPTYKTAILNGLPVVRFDGGDWFTTSASASLTAQTVFSVVRPTATTGLQSVLTAGGGGTGGLQWRLNSGKSNLVRQVVATIGTANTTVSTTDFQVLAAAYVDTTSYAFYHNGAADGSGSHAQTLSAARTQFLGGVTGFDLFTGDLAELMIYGSVLSVADRSAVTGYLGSKYGIGVAGNPAAFLAMF